MNDSFDKIRGIEFLFSQSTSAAYLRASQLNLCAPIGSISPEAVETMLGGAAIDMFSQSIQVQDHFLNLGGLVDGIAGPTVATILGRAAVDTFSQSVQVHDHFLSPGGLVDGIAGPTVETILGRAAVDMFSQSVQVPDHFLNLGGLVDGIAAPTVETVLGGGAVDMFSQSTQARDHLLNLGGLVDGITAPTVETMLSGAVDVFSQSAQVQDYTLNLRGLVDGIAAPTVETMFGGVAVDMLSKSTQAEPLVASVQSKTAHDYLFGDLKREQLLYQTSMEAALGTTSAKWLDMPKRIRELTGQMETFEIAPDIRALLGGTMLLIEDHLPALTTTSSAVIGLALDGWKSAIGERGFLDALSAPLRESALMASSSLDLLSRAGEDPGARRAIELSLMLNDADLRSSAAMIGSIAVEYDRSETRITEHPALYVPRFERNELHRRPALYDLELHEIVAEMKVGDVVILSREITSIVIEVNETCLIAGERPIFKMTDRAAKAIGNLPWMAVVDERTFADFIDALYWLLYEAPGSDPLRYLAEHGGVLSHDECGVIFVIKRLRNHYRHDPEHGKNIERKFESLAEDLRLRGFSSLPRIRADFRSLQRVLLAEACAFLRNLHAKIDEGCQLPS